MSVVAALRAQIAVLSALADQLEAGSTGAADEWVPADRWPVKGKPSRIAAKLPSARRHGRTWLARRADLDAYLEREGARPTMPALPPKRPKLDDIDRAIAELGLGVSR